MRDLIEANRLQPPFTLAAGMRLDIPGGDSHTVVRGDTLSALARHYHVDFHALAALNHKSSPYTIRVGERLRLPGGQTEVAVDSPHEEPGPAPVAPSPVAEQPVAPPAQQDPAPPAAHQEAASPPAAVPEPPPGGHGYLWPVHGEVLAGFGPQAARGQNNDGINIAAPKGTPVLASDSGVVAYVGNELRGFGNLILIKHRDGWMTAYGHTDQIMVRRGDSVQRGQQIGTVGATGSVTSPQLHFEIRHGSEPKNPADYLPSPGA